MDMGASLHLHAEGALANPDLVWSRVGRNKIPKPFPDEHMLSWCGRIYRVNDVERDVLAGNTFQRYIPFKVESLAELAALAGMGLDRFVRRQTMVPFMRAVVPDLTPLDSAGHRELTLNSNLRNISSWGGLRFCPDCVSHDRERRGIAFWHRMHLLPGVFWCPVHGTSLLRPKAGTTFVEEPGSHLLEDGEPKTSELALCDVEPAIQCYVRLAAQTLRRCRPIGSTTISVRLKSLFFNKLGNATSVDHYLKETVASSFPNAWLENTVPQRMCVARMGQAASDWYSMTVVWKKPRATERYLILASALCSDSRWLAKMIFAPERDARVALAGRMGRSMASNALINAVASEVATSNDLAERSTLRLVMLGLGETVTCANTAEAYAAFLKGLSVAEACLQNQAESSKLEALLRERLLQVKAQASP